MTTEISHIEGRSDADQGGAQIMRLAEARPGFTQEQIDLIKSMLTSGGEDLTNDELQIFLHVAERTGLDPLARQIYAQKRQGKLTTQTGIDGFRLTRERSPYFDGTEGPFWCGTDGAWSDVWLSKEAPAAAKFIVHKKGRSYPYIAVALFTEYSQRTKEGSLNVFWRTKPALMLAKCAEALATRQAFPQELSGVYTDDEIGTEPIEVVATVRSEPAPAWITKEQMTELAELVKELNFDKDTALGYCRNIVGRELEKAADLTEDEAAEVIAALQLVLGADVETGEIQDAEEVFA